MKNLTLQVSRNEYARYTVSQPCPPRPEKKLVPSSWWKPEGAPMHMDSSASVVTKTVTKRIPRYAGMKKIRIPTTAIASVHHAMNVWIGVKPELVFKWNRSAR